MPAPAAAVGLGLGQMATLFRSAVRGVVGAQSLLERELGPAYRAGLPVPGQNLVFLLPRAALNLAFGLEISTDRKILFIRRGSRKRAQHHRLRLELVAAPEPPELPGQAVEKLLAEPEFLVPEQEEKRLRKILAAALARGDATFEGRALKGKLREKAHEEAERIEVSPALIFFELAPGSFLAVRVAKSSGNDGLYRIQEKRPVTIYNIPEDRDRTVSYEPLHQLALAARRWLEDPSRLRRSPLRRFGRLGLEDLGSFVAELTTGYRDGLALLAGWRDGSGLPGSFDLSAIEAELSFSVQAIKRGFLANFRSWGDDEEIAGGGDRPPTSRVLISGRHEGGRIRLEARLLELEFLLAGEARETFFEQLDTRIEEVAKTMAEKGPVGRSEYRDLLASPDLRPRVVVFRSYERKSFEEELLVVWPGPAERDFAFTCERVGSQIKKRKIRPVMRLDQNLPEVAIGAGRAVPAETEAAFEELGKKQYRAFHRFFQAVLVWRGRGAAEGP